MNWNVMLKVLASSIFFAPLLLGLAFFLFLGVLLGLEVLLGYAERREASRRGTK